MNFAYKLGIIGYGNMSSAILGGAITSGVINRKDILIYDIDEKKVGDLPIASSILQVAKKCEYVLLSIKPQNAQEVLTKFSYSENILISIMAGVSVSKIREYLQTDANIVRCMPNTPCLIGKGMTALAYDNQTDSQKAFISSLFLSAGKILEVKEGDMNAVTSVSGSGPAYFYYFLNAVIQSGIKNGLSHDSAKQLAVQTAIGAAEMIESSDEDIKSLIERVCSKGGTTIQAIDYFNKNKIDLLIGEGLEKCFERAKELS